MQVFQAKEYFRGNNFDLFFRKSSLLQKMEKKFAPRANIHDKKEFFGRLESPVQFDQKWVI